jgi:hypothetical protein
MRLPSLKLEDLQPPPKQPPPEPQSPTEGRPLATHHVPEDFHPLNCWAETAALAAAIDSSFVQNHVKNALQVTEALSFM